MIERPTVRVLLALAWPVVLARATQAVIGFCDALMVSPLGEDALAATTMGALNTMNVVILPMGTVFIVQSFSAQLKGRGELESARRYAYYGFVIAGAAALLGAAALPFVGDVLGLFEYTPPVRAMMTDYLVLRLTSVGGIVATEVLGNWYGGLGNTRLHMWVGFIAMGANILLNYLLIEGHWGAPALGVAGAAIASALSSWIGFAVIATAFFRGYGIEGRPQRHGAIWRSLKRSELWRVLRFGLPNGFNWFLEFSAFILFLNVAVAHLGTTVLAALNVVFQINSISFMPAFGLASAGAILVGQAIGRRAHDDVWPILRMTSVVAAVWMVGAGLLYLLLPDALMGLFKPKGVPAESLLGIGATMLALSAGWQLFDALALTISEALRAAGDTTYCMWARVVLAWVVFTPISLLLVFVWGGGPVAVTVSLIVYLGALACVMAWRFRRGAWRRIELVEPAV
jgi:MATE family multidrug resistance protein